MNHDVMFVPAVGPNIRLALKHVPPDVADFLSAAQPTSSKETEAYVELLTAVVSELRPNNLIEAGYVKSVVDERWQIVRLRRVLPAIYGTKAPEPEYTPPPPERVQQLLGPTPAQEASDREWRALHDRIEASRRARLGFGKDHPDARQRLSQDRTDFREPAAKPKAAVPKRAQPTAEDDAALLVGFRKHSAEIERVNRLIVQSEQREAAALDGLCLYRSIIGRPAWSEPIIDAEFEEVADDHEKAGRGEPAQRQGQHRAPNHSRKNAVQPKRAPARARDTSHPVPPQRLSWCTISRLRSPATPGNRWRAQRFSRSRRRRSRSSAHVTRAAF